MHWFASQNASPETAAVAVMGITRSALAICSANPESKRLLEVIDEAKSLASSSAKAVALSSVLNDEVIRLPAAELLKQRPVAVTFSLRALECVCRVLHDEKASDTWKVIASGSLSAGMALVSAHNTLKAAKAAKKRHAEDSACRDQVLEWLESNSSRYRSMDAMARAIRDENLVPYKQSTVRTWIGQWRKSQGKQKT